MPSTSRTSGCRRTISPSLHCSAHVGAGEPETEHAAADDLVADAAVGTDAACIGHHALRLAGNVGARVPGVGQPMQRERCAVGHVPRPAGLRRFGRLDVS